MDAKAKVVAWQWQGSDGQWRECTFHGQVEYIRSGFPVRELVPLTDHEAALAEVESRLIGYVRLSDSAITQRDTLLSGLEALAGEWESEFSDDKLLNDQSRAYASQLRDTLTNSAKGGA